MKRLWHAIIFLTVFPTPTVPWENGDLGRSGRFFPLVGLLIGLILASVWLVGASLFPSPVTAVLIVITWAILTGGLHLDGLADCGDALFAAVSPTRRLEILKDSRIGAFGAITLILHLILKVTLVAALTTPYALLLAPVIGRWLILPTAKRPLARPGGMGSDFAHTITKKTIWWGALLPLTMAAAFGLSGVMAICGALLLTLAIWRFAQNRLNGITGDLFGLVVELVETAVLLLLI